MSTNSKTHDSEDNRRDYDFSEIEVDERFKQTTKEFFITLGVYLVFAALMISNLLVFNSSTVMVLGFPLWIFLEILIILGFVVAVIILSTYVYKDMDITSGGEVQDVNQGNSEEGKEDK